jgi:Putative auto-transporter adhesin, head GIN domain
MNICNSINTMKSLMKKQLNTIIFGLAIALLALSGCQGGPFCMSPKGSQVTQTISLAAISGIELAIDANVTLHRDSIQKIEITGSQNIIDNIELNVSGGVWTIEYDQCVRKSGNLTIDIWLPTLKKVAITGSGNVTGLDQFSGASTLEVSIAGSGNIDLQADADVVKTSITGSGDIALATTASRVDGLITGSGRMDLRGTCTHEDFEITGSGNIHAYDLLSENSNVAISGSGSMELQVSGHLSIVISGSGDVYYKGTPTIDSQVTGSGSVKHVN